jgi:PAS domain S-box-containing protein
LMQAEDLKTQENFVENALNTIRDIFIVFDLEGNFLVWNEKAKEVTGFTNGEIAEKKPSDFFRGGDIQRVAETIGRGLEEGFASVEAELVTKGGKTLQYEFYGTPLVDPQGQTIGVTAIGRDITERTMLAQREKDAAAAEAAAAAAERHAEDLREIIRIAATQLRIPAAILLSRVTDLLEFAGRIEDDEIKGAIRDTDVAASHLAHLINRLADMSRIDYGHLEVNRQDINPETVINRAIAETRAYGADHEFTIIDSEEAGRVRLDPELVKETLSILLDNAVMFSDRNAAIELWFDRVGDDAGFYVADRGPGIPEPERNKVFGRFYRLQDNRPDRLPGLGLGLYIARQYVEMHGGEIGMKPREGGGSVFYFTIPQ